MRGPGGYLKSDGDNDTDDHSRKPSDDDQQEMVLASRHGSSSSDRRAISVLVKRYFTVAVAGDAVTACSLLDADLAAATAAAQAKQACPAALSPLLQQQHQRLVSEEPSTMAVTGVHVSGPVGFVTVGFMKALESETIVQREGRTWKINALFDSPMP